jgi:hypothetical protein
MVLDADTARWLIVADDIQLWWQPDGGQPEMVTPATA